MQIAGHRLGLDGEEFQQIVDRPAEDIQAQRAFQIANVLTEHHGGRSLSPPTARATVFFKCPPTARIGGAAKFNLIGSGAKPRARRKTWRPSGPTRATESSTGRTMGRSWTRSRSAIGFLGLAAQSAEPMQGVVDLDGHRFLGEIAAGANQRPRDGFHQQVVQRRVGQHHAEIRIARGNIRGNVMPARLRDAPATDMARPTAALSAAAREWARRATTTRGLPSSETRQHCRTASSVGNIRAKGRSGRCFLRRRRSTAAASVASTRS